MLRLRAKLLSLSPDYRNKGEFVLQLAVKEIPTGVERLPEDLAVSLAKWSNRRSLDANAYHWVLVGKIAKVLGLSQNYVHNWMLRDHGQPQIVNGHLVPFYVPDTPDDMAWAMETDQIHLRMTSNVVTDGEGNRLRECFIIRGSHTYNTEEMSALIDGTVQEAKLLGIETMTPEELERMMGDYERRVEKY